LEEKDQAYDLSVCFWRRTDARRKFELDANGKNLFYMIIKKSKIYVAIILPSPTTTTGGVRASFPMLGAQLRWHFGG